MVTVASYIARKGGFLDFLIALRHFSKYSHSEIVFDDGWWFSSSARDGGPRKKRIEPKPGHWDFVPLPFSDAETAEIRAWCEQRVSEGHKYDFKGVLAFVVPFFTPSNADDFCSEFVTLAIQTTAWLKDLLAGKVFPGRLHAASKKLRMDLMVRNWSSK